MWDKSDRERQILYDISYMWHLKKPDIVKAESKMMVTRSWGMGVMGEMLFKGTYLQPVDK